MFNTEQATREFEYERLSAEEKDELESIAEEERLISTVWWYIIIFSSISFCICVGCIGECIWKCIQKKSKLKRTAKYVKTDADPEPDSSHQTD